jgi:SAM-dependent methyltransferase
VPAASAVSGFQYVGSELDVFAAAANWKAYMARLLHPYLRGAVLEVGAGIGATTQALWHEAVADWVCLEPDAALARQLRSIRLGAGGRVRPDVIVGTLADLPAARHFDTIIYIDVLEHIEDDRAELRRAVRHLAPGGTLIVLAPAFQFLFSEFDRSIGHQRRYTARSLSAVFPRELRRVKVFHADSLGMLLSLGNRLLLKQSLPGERQIAVWDRFVVPASRLVDPLLRRWLGRSVIAVFRDAR